MKACRSTSADIPLVIDLDADAEVRCDGCRVEAEQRGIGGQRLVPVVRVGDAADGHHHADTGTLEVVDNPLLHADRYAGGRIVRIHVEHLQRLEETQHHQVYGGRPVPLVDDPVVGVVEFTVLARQRPVGVVVARVPDAENLQRHEPGRRRRGWRRFFGAGALVLPGGFVRAGLDPFADPFGLPLVVAVADPIAAIVNGGGTPEFGRAAIVLGNNRGRAGTGRQQQGQQQKAGMCPQRVHGYSSRFSAG
jgi:hypothetical protein